MKKKEELKGSKMVHFIDGIFKQCFYHPELKQTK